MIENLHLVMFSFVQQATCVSLSMTEAEYKAWSLASQDSTQQHHLNFQPPWEPVFLLCTACII